MHRFPRGKRLPPRHHLNDLWRRTRSGCLPRPAKHTQPESYHDDNDIVVKKDKNSDLSDVGYELVQTVNGTPTVTAKYTVIEKSGIRNDLVGSAWNDTFIDGKVISQPLFTRDSIEEFKSMWNITNDRVFLPVTDKGLLPANDFGDFDAYVETILNNSDHDVKNISNDTDVENISNDSYLVEDRYDILAPVRRRLPSDKYGTAELFWGKDKAPLKTT